MRAGMIVRLAGMMDVIDPQPKIGRQRIWSTLIMLQALWHLARDGCTWRRLPDTFPPHTTVWSRLHRWRELAVLDRALAVVAICLRLARVRGGWAHLAGGVAAKLLIWHGLGPNRAHREGKRLDTRPKHISLDLDAR
jgi:transposase